MIYFCYVIFVWICILALLEFIGSLKGYETSTFDLIFHSLPSIIALAWLLWGQG